MDVLFIYLSDAKDIINFIVLVLQIDVSLIIKK